MKAGELFPSIEDGYGYAARWSDLDFLQVDADMLASFRSRSHPLGCDRKEWEQFLTSLDIALKNDGVSDADIRLQGSAAHFFSTYHKKMPYSPADLSAIFMQLRGRTPTPFEFERISRKISMVWPDVEDRPTRRPFDALHRLRIDRYPSDFDLQVSSDEIVVRAKMLLLQLGIPDSEIDETNPDYAFVKKELVKDVCPYLTSWAVNQSDILFRDVTVAVFASNGPPETPHLQSSHFAASDWCVSLGGGAL